MDPATFSLDQARQFARAGVNRASVGAQTFDPSLLKLTRRVHSPSDIATAVSVLHRASISNVSLDLIASLPHQTAHSWRSTLNEAIALQPNHISVYDLTLEPATSFGRNYSPGVHPLPPEDVSVQMLTDAFETLSHAGYHHYEVSNFAKTHPQRDFRSRHNLAYWSNHSFFAFGLGATSLIDRVRFARPRLLRQYRQYVDRMHSLAEASSDLDEQQLLRHAAFPGVRVQTDVECLEDYLINRFRLISDGVNFQHLRAAFGPNAENGLRSAVKQCSQLVDERLLVLESSDSDGDVVRLTEKGALVENAVVADLLWHAIWKHVEPQNRGQQSRPES
ncbi:coproporphyrinogen III oxidase [Gracilaria domingensis]|nr:coproporphyrinogen III oxidase [Gracilaria domingensis]